MRFLVFSIVAHEFPTQGKSFLAVSERLVPSHDSLESFAMLIMLS